MSETLKNQEKGQLEISYENQTKETIERGAKELVLIKEDQSFQKHWKRIDKFTDGDYYKKIKEIRRNGEFESKGCQRMENDMLGEMEMWMRYKKRQQSL